ncbi:hypothetical protein [Nonomuraea sp. NPDC052265]|uniref:hypothetical protein n=1 Tax=Nonomuraea sp. NPDC052265 TaxID=3364374 RepID=UPI0037CAE322
MKLSAPLAAGSAMLLVGTSTGVSATVAAYPVFTGQALRYALAAVILLLVVRRQRLPRVRLNARDVLLLFALAGTGLAGFEGVTEQCRPTPVVFAGYDLDDSLAPGSTWSLAGGARNVHSVSCWAFFAVSR